MASIVTRLSFAHQLLLTLKYNTQEGDELYSCQIFANQAAWLILLPDLDTAVGKYCLLYTSDAADE